MVKAHLISSVRKRIAYKKGTIFSQNYSIDPRLNFLDFSVEHQLISDEATEEKVTPSTR
jgi:hypothetical protein